MQMKSQYRLLDSNQYYIDKTEALEKGIELFPSIYIEGAAASGKTTAVKMLLEKHPEVEVFVFWMDEEKKNPEGFADSFQKLEQQTERTLEKKRWIIFENLDRSIPQEMSVEIIKYLKGMPSHNRAILVGRDRPAEDLLELYWKREMEIFPQETLLFSKEEILRFAEHFENKLDVEKIYEETGGWAGCVDVIFRMAARNPSQNLEELRNSYEINAYIRKNMLGVLSTEEQQLMQAASLCPWIDEMICKEILGILNPEDILNMLVRKGMFIQERDKNRWKIAPLFRKNYSNIDQFDKDAEKMYPPQKFWEALGDEYERQGCIKEALECLKKSGNEMLYRQCMIRHYKKVTFLECSYKEVIEWKGESAQIIYLQGMYAYFCQDWERLKKKIRKLEKLEESDKVIKEIYLNLMYVNPEISLDEWLVLLEKLSKDEESFRLYGILGGSVSFLCGLRDLAGLFACTRKEENHKAHIWKKCLGETEWLAYQLARIDYYMETERRDSLKDEDRELMDWLTEKGENRISEYGQPSWQIKLAGFALLCKSQMMGSDMELDDYIRQLEQSLCSEEATICARNAEAVSSVYALWRKEPEKLTHWLRYVKQEQYIEIREDNYYHLCCQVKGYLLLSQHEKAEKILRRVIPYLRNNRRYRYLAEVLFQQALVSWEMGRHSQALQNIIESFIVNGDSRYVGFYVSYGKRGKEVLDAYIEWQRANSPEGWHRKKKYNYGNVLRMPMADYMEVILRRIKREAKTTQVLLDKMTGEKLTMMETIILQDIGRGLTNAEICVELNLKMPTVKSHIYSLYKKLDANSRVQAVIKGKEKGILS